MTSAWLTLAAAGILAASPARADEVRTPVVEIGGNLSLIAPIVFADGPRILLGGGPRLTVNLGRRVGIELLAEALGPFHDGRSGTTGFYLSQLAFPLRRSHGGTLSFTVGAAGSFGYSRHPENRLVRYDGSTVVYPAFRSFRAEGARTLSVGVAREQGLGHYASGSLALQAFIGPFAGFAVRASAGVSLGVGRYR